ncbi:hypothetical protein [Burkholderia ubonensis]|uniref:hypothetical protein n=1 Tax=Burkholderia ubonensis TaxID=101571 RepID=UPI0011607FA4|nr:hypothetical protein [Burkholderia ubonensis]
MMSNPPSIIPWNDVFERFRKILDFAKDATDLAAKSSILLLIIPGLSLWVYLDRIGWYSLFLDSVSSTSGLLALLIGTLLLVSVLLFILCVPSIFLLFFMSLNNDLRVLSKSSPFVILLTVLFWMALVFAGSILFKSLSIPLILLATFAFCAAAALIGWRIDGTSNGQGKWKTTGKSVALSAIVTVATISSSAAFLAIESFAGDMSTDAKAYPALVVLLPLTLAGFLPGLMAISSVARNKPMTTAIKYVAIGVGLVLYALVMWSLTSFSTGIATRTLEKTGVYSVAPQDFELLKPDARASLEHVGISVTSSGLPIVHAYVRYAFGDIRLLCADKFVPGITDSPDDKFSSDATENKKARDKAREAGRNCVMLKRDDIRPIGLKQPA